MEKAGLDWFLTRYCWMCLAISRRFERIGPHQGGMGSGRVRRRMKGRIRMTITRGALKGDDRL
jgi:hypothetical protein